MIVSQRLQELDEFPCVSDRDSAIGISPVEPHHGFLELSMHLPGMLQRLATAVGASRPSSLYSKVGPCMCVQHVEATACTGRGRLGPPAFPLRSLSAILEQQLVLLVQVRNARSRTVLIIYR